MVEGNDAVTKDNWAGGVQTDGDEDSKVVLAKVKLDKARRCPNTNARPRPRLTRAYSTTPARHARSATRWTRVIASVRKGTATEGTKDGIITDIKQVGGYPVYKGEPVKDGDGDGIPDWWETKYGLNPNDASDPMKDTGDGYTNVEKYINSIDPTKKVDWKDLNNNRDPLTGGR